MPVSMRTTLSVFTLLDLAEGTERGIVTEQIVMEHCVRPFANPKLLQPCGSTAALHCFRAGSRRPTADLVVVSALLMLLLLSLPALPAEETPLVALPFSGGQLSSFFAEHTLVMTVSTLLLLATFSGMVFGLSSRVGLAASGARLKSMMQASDIGTWEWHVPSGRIRVDQQWASMLGYRSEEFQRDITAWRRLLHPEDVPRFDEAINRHISGHDDRYEVELRLQHSDGRWVWGRDVGRVVSWGRDGQPLLMHGTHIDISAEKERSEQLDFIARRDRSLLLLSNVCEDRSEHDFAQMALQWLEELTGSSISFLHFVDEDRQDVQLIAWSRRTHERYCKVADCPTHYPLAKAGIWAESVATRTPILINDYAQAVRRKGLPDGHADIQRFVTVPVIDFSAVVMLIGVGNKQADYVDRDVESAQLFAIEIWRLIQRGRNEASLQQASMVFDYAREGIIVTDARNRIVDVNPAFERISGYEKSEVLGADPRMFRSGRQDETFYHDMWERLGRDDLWEGEIWNRRKNGDVYPQHLNVSVIRDGAGDVLNHIALFSDITLLKKQQDALQRLVHYDPLTGLPNRVLYIDRLQQAMARVTRHHRQLAVAFMDLDGFKEVNDVYGHDVGDEVLIEIAARLKAALRVEDTVARLGGDEFVAILSDFEHLAVVEPLFDRLLVAASTPLLIGDVSIRVSVSIGVSLFPRDDNLNLEPEQLVREADQAMYQAKNSGKNRLAFFSDAE